MSIRQLQVFQAVVQTGTCRFMYIHTTLGHFADKPEATHHGLVALLLLTR